MRDQIHSDVIRAFEDSAEPLTGRFYIGDGRQNSASSGIGKRSKLTCARHRGYEEQNRISDHICYQRSAQVEGTLSNWSITRSLQTSALVSAHQDLRNCLALIVSTLITKTKPSAIV